MHPPTLRVASLLLLTLVVAAPLSAQQAVAFSKQFDPSSISAGNVSTLVFTLENFSRVPLDDLAFVDTLPAGLTVDNLAGQVNGCGGSLSAPAGGGSIALDDARLEIGESCEIRVDVATPASPSASYDNVSGALTSNQGSHGTAAATLFTNSNLPLFGKTFTPAMVETGVVTTLTLTFESRDEVTTSLDVTDPLPAGVEIAAVPNVTDTCGGTVTAPAGGDTITVDGFVSAGSSCSVSVDVRGTVAGTYLNRTDDLLVFSEVSAGRATALLTVTQASLELRKEALDDPVGPGGTFTFRFEILNANRSAATAISFSDDLDAALAGLVAVDLPDEPCGAGSSLTGTSTLTLAGGSLGAGETCTFDVVVEVPDTTDAGLYVNSTSTVTASVGGEPDTGPAAQEEFEVLDGLVVTKEFAEDLVAAGDSVDLTFVFTNTFDQQVAVGSITDLLLDFISGATASGFPASGFCGPSSDSGMPAEPTFYSLSLDAGASCTVTLSILIPENAQPGEYVNETTDVEAFFDGGSVVLNGAWDTLRVIAAPTLTKEFDPDLSQPGEVVDLTFTLLYSTDAVDEATGIAFTDDLGAALPGLTLVALPAGEVCGPGSTLSGEGSGILTFSDGTLEPGDSCSFTVSVAVPADAAPGTYTNVTSQVSATTEGVPVIAAPASDFLTVPPVGLTKEFVPGAVDPGGQVDLQFTLDNPTAQDASDLAFTDDLDAALSGLTAVTLPAPGFCGPGSTLTGSSVLTFSGGFVAAGGSCTFTVTLQVPGDAAAGEYQNVSSDLTGQQGGGELTSPPARDELVVLEPVRLDKEFVDDPAMAGGTTTLRFTITNLSPVYTATGISFTDDLEATLPGLTALGLPSVECNGGTLSGTSTLTFTGGSLAASTSCFFDVTLQLPAEVAVSEAVNQTSEMSFVLGDSAETSAPASDTLQIASDLTFTKSFDGPTVSGGSPVLTFTLVNDGVAVDDLRFSDDLDAVLPGLVATGLPATVCNGGTLSGTSLLTFVGGELGSGESCSFDVTLVMPEEATPGDYTNVTSAVSSQGQEIAPPASADLRVNKAPIFAKRFDPIVIPLGGTSTLVFSIENTGSTVAATGLAFTDDLPAGLVVATPSNAATTCSGGTLTAVAGSTSISYSGGTVAADSSCTVEVDVFGGTEGDFVNVSSSLASSLGESAPATATLQVAVLGVAKELAHAVLPGGTVELTFTLVNGSGETVMDLTFSDDLGAVLPGLTALGLPAANVCGAGSNLSGSTVITLTGGVLEASGSCEFTVTLQVPGDAAPGSYLNTTTVLQGTQGESDLEGDPASDTLEVVVLGFEKAFADDVIVAPGTTTLTFTITNPDPVNAATGISFMDDLDAMLAGTEALGLPQSDVCGAGSTLQGESVIVLDGGSLAPGGSCSFDVQVQLPDVPGVVEVENVTTPLAADVGGGAGVGAVASDALVVQPSFFAIPVTGWPGLLLLVGLLGLFGWRRLG